MANYNAKFRTSYATVRDCAAFLTWAETIPGLEPITRTSTLAERYFAVICAGGMPDTDNEGETIDFCADLAAHLEEDQTIILMEVGSEAYRYLIGEATALHANGETVTVSLHEIYARASEAFGNGFSQAQY